MTHDPGEPVYLHALQIRGSFRRAPHLLRLAISVRTRASAWLVDPRTDIVIFVDVRVAPALQEVLAGRRGVGAVDVLRACLLDRIDDLLDPDGASAAGAASCAGTDDAHFPRWAVLNLLSARAAADIARVALVMPGVHGVSIMDPEASMPLILDRRTALLVRDRLLLEHPSDESLAETAHLHDYLEDFLSYAVVREGSVAIPFRPGPIVRTVRCLLRRAHVGR